MAIDRELWDVTVRPYRLPIRETLLGVRWRRRASCTHDRVTCVPFCKAFLLSKYLLSTQAKPYVSDRRRCCLECGVGCGILYPLTCSLYPQWRFEATVVENLRNLTLSRAEVSTGYTSLSRSNLHFFLISDIRALWRSVLSARVPKCHKLKTQTWMALNTSRCNHLTPLHFKGLMLKSVHFG